MCLNLSLKSRWHSLLVFQHWANEKRTFSMWAVHSLWRQQSKRSPEAQIQKTEWGWSHREFQTAENLHFRSPFVRPSWAGFTKQHWIDSRDWMRIKYVKLCKLLNFSETHFPLVKQVVLMIKLEYICKKNTTCNLHTIKANPSYAMLNKYCASRCWELENVLEIWNILKFVLLIAYHMQWALLNSVIQTQIRLTV